MFFCSGNDQKNSLLKELLIGNRTFCFALQTSSLLLARAFNSKTDKKDFPMFAMYSLSVVLDSVGNVLFNKSESEVLFRRHDNSNEPDRVASFVKNFMYSFNRIKFPGIVLLDTIDKHRNKAGRDGLVQRNTASTIAGMLQSSDWLRCKVHNDKVWFIQALVDSWFIPVQISIISPDQVNSLCRIPRTEPKSINKG